MRRFYCIAVRAETLCCAQSDRDNAGIPGKTFRMTGKTQVTRKIMIKAEMLHFDQRDSPLEYLLLRQRLFAVLRVTGFVDVLHLVYHIKNSLVSVKSSCSVWNGQIYQS